MTTNYNTGAKANHFSKISPKSKRLASSIRKKQEELNEITEKYKKQIQELKDKCEHEFVVQTQGYDEGSYWHPEVRRCMICGKREFGTVEDKRLDNYTHFDVLTEYQLRCSTPSWTKNQYPEAAKEKQLNCMNYPLKEVVEFCETFGMK